MKSKLKWIFGFGISIVVLAIACVATLHFTGHELGPRPSSSVEDMVPRPDVQYIEANDITFAYLERGDGPLVLLFHGYPETAASWDAVQRRIAQAGYRTIAIYMRGYPPSDPGADYSIRTLGQDVISLIDAFGEEKAIIVGHDWGASTVYEAAHIASDKISHLIALSVPHPLGISDNFDVLEDAPHFLYYQSPFAERLVWSNDFAHIRRIYKTWSPEYDVPEAEITDIISTFRHPGAITNALGYYHAIFANGDENSEIGADSLINTPSLIIAGTHDGATPLELFTAASPAFVGPYTLDVLDGVGHFPQLEAPEEVAASILSFLEEVEFETNAQSSPIQ